MQNWFLEINNPHNGFLLAGMEPDVAGMLVLMVNAPFRDAALGVALLWLLGAGLAGHKVAHNE